jgi:hypothetical protein
MNVAMLAALGVLLVFLIPSTNERHLPQLV